MARRTVGEKQRDVSYPSCEEQETLAHILNHCPFKVGLLRLQHNRILARLAQAISPWKGLLYNEQCIPGDTSRLKPDLAILNETSREAYIIDVTMPFEGTGTFQAAQTAKEQKYDHLKVLL